MGLEKLCEGRFKIIDGNDVYCNADKNNCMYQSEHKIPYIIKSGCIGKKYECKEITTRKPKEDFEEI